jgi:PAS domain S-box-containing protein
MPENNVEDAFFLARLKIAQSQLQNFKRQTERTLNLQAQTPQTLPDLEKALEELRLAEGELALQYKQLVNTQTQLAHERLRYLQLFELAPCGYIVTDTQGNILEANHIATTILQLSATKLCRKPFAVFIPKQVRPTFYAHLTQVIQTNSIQRWESQLQPYRASTLEVEIELGVIAVEAEPQHLSWLLRDITEEKRAKEQLRILSRRLMHSVETERRALSRELHDDFGQVLTALRLTLEKMADNTMNPEYEDALGLIAYLSDKVRNTALDLRPSMLDDLGLFLTLVWYFTRYTQQTGIQVHFIRPDSEKPLNPDTAITAYRIVQETLTNVARYAQVTEVTVHIWFNDQHFFLQIADKGKGFSLELVQAKYASSGLVGMKERTALVGGELTIHAAPKSGTCITAKIPLP